MRLALKWSRTRTKERLIEGGFLLCASMSVVTTLGILAMLVIESYSFFREVVIIDFLTDTAWTPFFADQHFGILPLVLGTLTVTLIAALVCVPASLIMAAYLAEFAPRTVRRVVKPLLEVLSSVPTVVYGYFALLTVTPLLREVIPSVAAFNGLSAGIVVGIMILPMTTSMSEDAIRAVPSRLREAAVALGSTPLQATFRVVVPAAGSGICAALILGLARALGETMIVTIAAGQQPQFGVNPLEPVQTLTAFIAQVSLGDVPAGTLENKTVFAVAMVLFTATFLLSGVSTHLRRRHRKGKSDAKRF